MDLHIQKVADRMGEKRGAGQQQTTHLLWGSRGLRAFAGRTCLVATLAPGLGSMAYRPGFAQPGEGPDPPPKKNKGGFIYLNAGPYQNQLWR
jgi:hypothetical protein